MLLQINSRHNKDFVLITLGVPCLGGGEHKVRLRREFFCTRNDLHILLNLIQHLDACHTSMLLRKNLQILFRVGRSNKIEKSSLNNLMDSPCYLQDFM